MGVRFDGEKKFATYMYNYIGLNSAQFKVHALPWIPFHFDWHRLDARTVISCIHHSTFRFYLIITRHLLTSVQSRNSLRIDG